MDLFESDLLILDAELRSDDLVEHTRNQYRRELERWHEWAVEHDVKSFTQRTALRSL